MSINNVLSHILPPCCNLAAVPVQVLPEREKRFFASSMPDAVTAIVTAHHVLTEEEWTWYATPGSEERCDADDHLRGLCEAIRDQLEKQEYHAGERRERNTTSRKNSCQNLFNSRHEGYAR